MPPQPPEETTVLSHRSVQDSDPRLAIHPKDPLAFTSFQAAAVAAAAARGGLKSRNTHLHLPLKGDYGVTAPPPPTSPLPQENGQYFDHSLHQPFQQPNRTRRQSHHHSNGNIAVYEPHDERELGIQNGYRSGGVGVTQDESSTPGESGLSTPSNEAGFLHHHHHHTNGYMNGHAVTTFSSGPLTVTTATSISRNVQRIGGQPSNIGPILMPAPPLSPSKTAKGLMEPTRESNVEEHNGHHPYYQNFYQQHQNQLPYNQHQYHQQQVHSYDPYSTPSPAMSYYSPFEGYQSRYSTPLLQPHQLFQPTYESPKSSPIDLDQHYRAAPPNPRVFPSAVTEVKSNDPTIAQIYGLKSSHVSLWKKSSWIVFTMSIFLMPYFILKACFHVQVSAGAWQTSITYGMLMAVDFLAVITFSALNRRQVNKRVRKRDPHWVGLSTGILAVGYREDPILLEGCLKSLRAIRYQRNQRVLLVVDGNESQDEYMAQIFMKVFEKQGAAVFRPDFLCMDREASDKGREDLVRQIAYHPGPVCVMQPHRGKRSAMYTGFAALLQQGIESVVVTDSDTYLDPNVCRGKNEKK